MSKRKRSLPTRGAAHYAERVGKIQPFVVSRFPSFAKASKADKSRALRIFKTIYGWGDRKKPIFSPHSTVIHLVPNAKAMAAAEKLETAFTKKLKAGATVRHVYQQASPEELADMKRGLGQKTSRDINTIFLRQDQVPGKPDTYITNVDVIRLADQWLTISGGRLSHFRPFNLVRWAIDPHREQQRVLDQLHEDAHRIRAYFSDKRGVEILRKDIRYTFQVGDHQSYGEYRQANDDDAVHDQIDEWVSRYGQDASTRADRAPVKEWLRGINMILFKNLDGFKQYHNEFTLQHARRLRKRERGLQVKRARLVRDADKMDAKRRKKRQDRQAGKKLRALYDTEEFKRIYNSMLRADKRAGKKGAAAKKYYVVKPLPRKSRKPSRPKPKPKKKR